MIDKRQQELLKWLSEVLKTDDFTCETASSDASFRRYFRVSLSGQTYIAMDAPPEKEDCTAFLAIAKLLRQQGVNAPKVFKQSLSKGFLLLSDLGKACFLDKLTLESVDNLYSQAVGVLHLVHELPVLGLTIPAYDSALLQREMDLFNVWFLDGLLGIKLSTSEHTELTAMMDVLIESALEQPQVFVHRDYHSRNLMLTDKGEIGVIDFQDAVVGPITYDLVSLFRDCYIDWPDDKVYSWLDQFLQQRHTKGCLDKFDTASFYRWFDLMGAQRHMKAIGIFSRLLLRDKKSGYLQDIPRTLGYLVNVCSQYKVLSPMTKLLDTHQVSAAVKRYLMANA